MKTYEITTKITTNPDFSGGLFYVEAGGLFDADDYAEHAGINRFDLDQDSVKAAVDKSAQLNDGEWLLVDHEEI